MLGRVFAWSGAALFAASLVYFLYCYLVPFGRPAASGGWAAPSLLNALLFSIFALHHSALARPGARAIVARAVAPHLERVLYTWAASVLFIAVCWLWQPVPGVAYELRGWAWWAGVSVQLAGLAITAVGSAAADPLDLSGVRRLRNPHASPARVPLRTTGVYGFVRHPIYLGWILVVFGTPTMTATRLAFALISTAYLALAVPFEERGLVASYGSQYHAYQRQVRWRMLPGLY